MFVDFLYELRQREVPVGTSEALMLAKALEAGLHDSSLEGFYDVARALLVHSEAHLDAFDRAFLAHFRGKADGGRQLAEELLEWLRQAKERPELLRPEELALLERLDAEALRRMFEDRLREQTGRHDGGNKWIGTGGSSPFGHHGGAAREGFRVGGEGGLRSAVEVADARRFEAYRDDIVLDTRQVGVALRKLRAFSREGSEQELDLEGTIEATAKNAGELEVVTRPPRRPNTGVILMMDVGGSMTPYAHLVSRLFSAASRATHFKELRTYYFHNCVYGRVYATHRMDQGITTAQLMAECNAAYKLIFVGDALMAPYELLSPWGSSDWSEGEGEAPTGLSSLLELGRHFPKSAWLNPEPRGAWRSTTIEVISRVFPMFPFTLEGLGEAVRQLTQGTAPRGSPKFR